MNSNKPDNLGMEWEPGQLLLGDFEVQRVLGQGGMGKVYLVRGRTTGMEFAVKHALIKDDDNRQNFLSELQTWIDLPEHPHIAACRFFRTIGDEIAIFAEYVGGGTLADWIQNRRLTTLEEILDVAIQFAWGLQALHEHGLIHQDMKPGNILMTPEGIAKITDFGLARARVRSGDEQFYSPDAAPSGQSVLVSFGGMTQAYCSPEQAAKQLLSRKTDIWSWGVSVLDMFYGQPSCLYGQTAGESLEAYFQDETLDKKLPRMPVEMTMVLGKCFQPKPEHRWENMREVADALVELYNKVNGAAYPRQVSAISVRGSAVPGRDGRTAIGTTSSNPARWLQRALRAEGRDPAQAAHILGRYASSRRGQLVADLAAYDEARRIFERLIKAGRKDLEDELAMLCHEAASAHEIADDSSGALAMYDRAIEIYERLVNVEGRRKLVHDLASSYMNKAITLCAMADYRDALNLFDRAIAINENLVKQEGSHQMSQDLAAAYVNKANAVSNLGDHRGAVTLYDNAIETYERLIQQGGRFKLYGWLKLPNDLAMVCMNKTAALLALGENRKAIEVCDRAIEIRERLVNQEGQTEVANDLASAYVNKANALHGAGDYLEAVRLYDRAINVRERLVNEEGRSEVASDLSLAYVNKASAVSKLGDTSGAIALYDCAIEIREQLVKREGRSELLGDLALARGYRAEALIRLGDRTRGLDEGREAIAILWAERRRTGRADLQAAAEWLTRALSEVRT
jgi:tetratricopeptide (TPR) repeat protein/predicted Ser/Thr protein kinase